MRVSQGPPSATVYRARQPGLSPRSFTFHPLPHSTHLTPARPVVRQRDSRFPAGAPFRPLLHEASDQSRASPRAHPRNSFLAFRAQTHIPRAAQGTHCLTLASETQGSEKAQPSLPAARAQSAAQLGLGRGKRERGIPRLPGGLPAAPIHIHRDTRCVGGNRRDAHPSQFFASLLVPSCGPGRSGQEQYPSFGDPLAPPGGAAGPAPPGLRVTCPSAPPRPVT